MIPSEWFYTAHDTPQLRMWIDGMPALCTGTNCDFEYEYRSASISSYTLLGTSLSIVGTNLPLTPVSIEMGYVNCVISTNDASTIECDLEYPVPGGEWLPQVKDQYGLVRVDSGVADTVITATITSITPDTGLNPAGG